MKERARNKINDDQYLPVDVKMALSAFLTPIKEHNLAVIRVIANGHVGRGPDSDILAQDAKLTVEPFYET